MKQRAKNTLKIAFILTLIIGIAPFLLAKTNFYGQSHANYPEITPIPEKAKALGVVSYAESVKKAAPAVVSIQTTSEVPNELNPMMQDPFFRFFFGEQFQDQFGQQFPPKKELQQGLGSGVIIDKTGHILTNNHVIKDAKTIKVKLADGRESEAKVIGNDPQTDLAVLKTDLKNLPIIPLGSSESLQVGDVVLAIGNPFNVGQTVTQGIISATHREGDGDGGLGLLHDHYIQTDAAINPGNSGGALVDAYGRLIGINIAIYTRTGGYQGIGFAVPIDSAMDIMKQLASGGKIVRGFLGVQLMPVDRLSTEQKAQLNYKSDQGAYVRQVFLNTPAHRAGLLPGDILIKINKTKVKNATHATKIVANLKPNEDYLAEVSRKGEHILLSIRITERPNEKKK